MINFIKKAVESVEGIKSFLYNTDYRNNFDIQNVEFPCCVLTPIMNTKYDLSNFIHESAELQISIIDTAPFEYTGDDLYNINKRCSDLLLQVIANLQVKTKFNKDLTFEFILPSGDELVSGVMCNLQCTMKQGSCIGAPSYVEVVVQPAKSITLYQNGKYNIMPDKGFNAIEGVAIDVNVAGGGDIDLSDYYTKVQTDELLAEKLSTSQLNNAIDQALLQAKESGEFKGEKGDRGEKGEQGERGEQGLQGEKGEKGEDGQNGKDGADGKTPVKGVDYFTDADKQELIAEIDVNAEIPIINQTSNAAEIQPNVLNIWGEVAELTITLATPTDESIVNEYMIQFTSGDIATQLTLPDTITWMSEPTINPNATYQISIINNLAVIGEFSNE